MVMINNGYEMGSENLVAPQYIRNNIARPEPPAAPQASVPNVSEHNGNADLFLGFAAVAASAIAYLALHKPEEAKAATEVAEKTVNAARKLTKSEMTTVTKEVEQKELEKAFRPGIFRRIGSAISPSNIKNHIVQHFHKPEKEVEEAEKAPGLLHRIANTIVGSRKGVNPPNWEEYLSKRVPSADEVTIYEDKNFGNFSGEA